MNNKARPKKGGYNDAMTNLYELVGEITVGGQQTLEG